MRGWLFSRPLLRTRLRIECADGCLSVDREDLSLGHNRCRSQTALHGAARADRHFPGLAKGLPDCEMSHRLGRIAAGLRPFGVCDRLGQGHGQLGRRRVDDDVLLSGQDIDTLADHGRLRSALLEDAASACRKRGERQQRNSRSTQFHLLQSCCSSAGSEALASTPSVPAICTARLRMVLGTCLSAATAANMRPASAFLPCLR